MEIKQYFYLFKKWLWLLILGGLIGGLVGYFISSRQPEVYQTSTRIMVSRGLDQEGSSYYFYNEIQLAKTYTQLINTRPVLDKLSEQLGFQVRENQVSIKQVQDSLVLDVTVSDNDAERTALIANSLVDVFINYNESLQTSRYEASESSLQAQINQVETQISALQDEIARNVEQSQEIQKQEEEIALQKRLEELKLQLDLTEADIIKSEDKIASFFPIPAPTSTPASRYRPTPTAIPTPTLSPEDQVALKEEQNRLDQLQTLRDLYKQTYANLLVLGESGASGTGNTQARQDQLQAALTLYQQIYSNLLNNYEAVRLARLRSTPNIVQIQPASVPGRPIKPQPVRDISMGSVIGIFLLGSVAFLIEYLDDTLKTPEDITRHLQLPVVGLIGEMEKSSNKNQKGFRVYVSENPLSPITESFRTLRTNLEFAGVDKPLKSLLITSTAPGEGKSTIAANLAAVIAQGERKVVLMDTDLRRPTLHRHLQIANRRGLSDLFRDSIKVSNVINSWGDPPIAVITSGGLPPNPSELLASTKMEAILQDLKNKSDVIIMDAPPCVVADPIILSARVDGVLLVIEPGKTKIGSAQVVIEQLHRAGARIIGVVLNPISRRQAGYYTKYQNYSTYYSANGYHHATSGNGAVKKTNTKPIISDEEYSASAD